MTVKELIEKLQKFDPEAELHAYGDDIELVYDIEEVEYQDEVSVWLYLV